MFPRKFFAAAETGESVAELPVPALPLDACFAKTVWTKDGAVLGATVVEHAEAALACDRLIAGTYPSGILPEGSELAVGLHDVGKIGIEMQKDLRDAAGIATAGMLELAGADPEAWRKDGGHAATGAKALLDEYGPEAKEAAMAIAAHHGRHLRPRAPVDGREWQARRKAYCRMFAGESPRWPQAPKDGVISLQAFRSMLAGRIAAADWSASLAADMAGLGRNWRPHAGPAVRHLLGVRPRIRTGLSFRDIFGFEPRPAQQAFFEAVQGPGIYVLEAGTGTGKTEAALYAAYRELCRGCRGIYFGLPTRLTSLKMLERLKKFTAAVCTDGAEAALVHAGAWLEHDPECGQILSPKAALLRFFGAGTVDQALMAGINVRHAGLRLYGLAGKTVVLDEVHSYDAYTGSLVCHLAKLLAECGCTVIILSATLASSRRAALLGMPAGGPDAPYPLATALPKGAAEPAVLAPEAEETADMSIAIVHAKDAEAFSEAVLRAQRGERVLWIENSVGEAQDAFRRLSAAAGPHVRCGLLHSRFTQADRARHEEVWTREFRPCRPVPEPGAAGCILVGTQVLEQSLDIDADFLVLRFCPSDMLIQRLGRLWRNPATGRPAGCIRPEAWLLHPDPALAKTADPKGLFGVSALVYEPYVLLRSLEIWAGMQSFSVRDVRRIVEATYAEREESSGTPAATALREAMARRTAMTSQAGRAMGTAWSAMSDAEENAVTRLMERPTWTVLVVRSLDGRRAVLADGREVVLPPESARRGNCIGAVRMLAESCVAVQAAGAPGDEAPERLRRWLGPSLRAVLLLNDGRLAGLDGMPLSSGASYSAEIGWILPRRHGKTERR